MQPFFETEYGKTYNSKVEVFLNSEVGLGYKNKINLLLTSPPFPMNRKKKYGNYEGQIYLDWLASLAELFKDYLAKDGSIVIELGNSWEKGVPVMSTLSLEALLAFKKAGNYKLCQQFIWHNTAKLPTPAQWVNIERSRVKDSFTYIWWLSNTEFPKANNKNILIEYSKSMKNLLATKKYNSGSRPSEHHIGEKSFLTDNSGAIPSNVLISANTGSSTPYQKYCKEHDLTPHPARMPESIPEFFIKFLTSEGDLVFDPFGGSNTTGYVAEKYKRNWISTEVEETYLEGSKGRFENKR